MNLPEILQWIQYGQKTGTLVFERRGVVKKIYLEAGQIVSASSNDPREYLGQILVCFGWLTEEQLKDAFHRQKDSNKLLGRILVEDFKLSEDQILKCLVIKIEETIYSIFLWDDGRFIYSEGLKGLSDHDRLQAAISIDQVLFEGARRVDEFREFRKAFPHDQVVFELKSKKKILDKFEDNPIISKIYAEIDGKKTLQRILLDTHAPEYLGYEAFGKLYWAELIAPIGAVKPLPKAKLTDYQEELLKAAQLYKSKNYEEAYQIIENFLANRPENKEAQTLFGAIREAYRKALYEVCPPDSIPELVMDFSELNEQIYSSKEGYLASRINGEWDVKSLIMISPLGEFGSLQILKRLHDEGMIRMKKKKDR